MKKLFAFLVSLLNPMISYGETDFSQKQLPIKAVIFDCDGTLVDSEILHCMAWQHAFKRQGYKLSRDEYKRFAGWSRAHILKTATTMIGQDCSEQLEKDKVTYFKMLHDKGVDPIDPTVNFLHSLFKEKKSRNLKFAVASAAKKEDIINNLNHLGITHYFDVILSGTDDLSEYHDEDGTNKPKPYIYLKTVKMLGVLPQECIVIEDSEAGVSAATAAGCITVAIPNYFTQNHNLSKAHLKIDSLEGYEIDRFMNEVMTSSITDLVLEQ